ncbi:MAG: hypothetical protein NVS3B10_24760 [Polyangiales bacterium]
MKLRQLGSGLAMLTASALAVAGTLDAPDGLQMATPGAISEMDRRLGVLDQEIGTAQKELAQIAPARQASEIRVRARGRGLYRLMRAGLMPLGGGFSSFVDHAQRVERLKRALAGDLEGAVRLSKRGLELAATLDGWTRERATLADKKHLAEAAKIAIDEERARREAFERAFASSYAGPPPRKGSDEIVVYGPTGSSSPESLDPASFKARRGRLTFPVVGQAEVRATVRDGGPGVEIKAPLGAIVRAVHPGRVAFADRYGTYGSLVILDHGARCYTVSGNLGSIDVKVGDELSAGERLGTVGDDGKGPAL